MADHIISGILKDPAGEFSVGDKIRFTHTTTTGNTIMGAQSQFTVPPDGSYTIALQYGVIKVEYLDVKAGSWRNLGNITINQDTATTTLPGLLNALIPPTDSTLLEIQSLVADAEQYASDSSDDADRAEAAVLSIVNDNLLTNGGFDIWQRDNTSSETAISVTSYYADRWRLQVHGGGQGATTNTFIGTREEFTLGQTDVPNNPKYYQSFQVSALGSLGSDDTAVIRTTQLIENVRTCAGEEVTVSFYAKCDTARDVRVVLGQKYDLTAIFPLVYADVSLTTEWERYSVTLTVPSLAGKTITIDDHSLFLNFIYYSGSDNTGSGVYNSHSFGGSFGTWTTGTFDLAQVKLEKGANYTGWPHVDPATELMKCQRYYQKITNTLYAYFMSDEPLFRHLLLALPTTMRSNPAVSATYNGWSGTPTVYSQVDSVSFFGLATNISTAVLNLTLDAEL